MEQENDYIEREVKKLVLFLKMLLSKLSIDGIQIEKSVINELDIELKEKLSISFTEMLLEEKKQLTLKLENINIVVLEDLINVFYEIYKNEDLTVDRIKLKYLILSTINSADNKYRTFSLERQGIKKNLNNEIIT